MMTFGIRPDWGGRGSSGARVIALLVVLTVLPAACVLWFMTAALENDAAAAQQRILGAYRGQLRLVRSRLDGLWRTQATAPDDHRRSGAGVRAFDHQPAGRRCGAAR